MKDYNKQFDELIERINKLRSDIDRHFEQPEKMVGWCKNEYGGVAHLTGKMLHGGLEGYGFGASGSWYDAGSDWGGTFTPCTSEEVEAMLITEAKRRGYGKGVTVMRNWIDYTTFELESDIYTFSPETNVLTCNGWQVFNNGQWAEVVKPSYTIQGDTISGLTEEQIQKVKEVLG